MADSEFPHLFVPDAPDGIRYRNPAGGNADFETPPRPQRREHADRVKRALDRAWKKAEAERDRRAGISLPAKEGTYLEIESAPGFELKLKSLEDRTAGIELLNVREEVRSGEIVSLATIYVPKGKHVSLIRKIQRYRDENTKKGKPKNRELIESIETVRRAVLQSFWYDPVSFLPSDHVREWCEVWLVTDEAQRARTVSRFRAEASSLKVNVQEGEVHFVERTVLLVEANASELEELLAAVDGVAEFRRAKETAAFWTELPNKDQALWVSDLADRISVVPEPGATVCVLDTGVALGHPLLQPLITDANVDTVDADWGHSDRHGHGTAMVGTVTFGTDLAAHLQADTELELPFDLQSIKLIDQPGMASDPKLHGERTLWAFSRSDLLGDRPNRVFCMAVTSEDGRDRGRPSSWSGALDKAICGAEGGERRLCIVSAGNVTDAEEWKSYPDANLTNSIHDPAQAWNALSVASVTFMDNIDDPALAEAYTPLAQKGQISPYSTSSRTWERRWPNKPDIVLEGGNVATDRSGFSSQFDALSLLSLGHRPQEALLAANFATSAAAGLASEMAARLWAAYPTAWPETIRALMVHASSWPEALRAQLVRKDLTATENMQNLLRVAGYGVPDIARALQSARNSLTLISQEEIQPFEVTKTKKGKSKRARDMHLHRLPWPRDALQSLPGQTPVKIDVTLSYFVEPAPGEKGWRDKYRYRSHGLDFNIKKGTETEEEFVLRLNKLARDEESGEDHGGSSVPWVIGEKKGRTAGSIHRDWVELTAAEAAESHVVGVFPRSGWWKERDHLGRGNNKSRYALIVTVRTPSTNIDLYTPVATKIEVGVSV